MPNLCNCGRTCASRVKSKRYYGTEAYSQPCQTSTMERSAKIVNSFSQKLHLWCVTPLRHSISTLKFLYITSSSVLLWRSPTSWAETCILHFTNRNCIHFIHFRCFVQGRVDRGCWRGAPHTHTHARTHTHTHFFEICWYFDKMCR